MSRMRKAGRKWRGPHAQQYYLLQPFLEIWVRGEEEAESKTSQNENKNKNPKTTPRYPFPGHIFVLPRLLGLLMEVWRAWYA